MGPLPIRERIADLSRIMGRYLLSPFEMFGIPTEENMKYIGVEHEELSSGKGDRHSRREHLRPNPESQRFRD